MMRQSFLKNKILCLLVVLMIFGGVFGSAKEARAQAAVIDAANVVQNTFTAIASGISSAADAISAESDLTLMLKEYVLDPLANIAAQTIIRALTQQILGWIQGKDVGFVQNLDQEFRRAADAAGGEFLNNLSRLNLCGNFSAFLNITLRTPGLKQKLECTVTDIVSNIQNYYSNFEQGGLPAFIRFSLEPQNNTAGAFLIALDGKIAAESNARTRIEEGARYGKGFLGFRVPVRKNCIPVSASSGGDVGKGSRGLEEARANPSSPIINPVTNRGFAAIGSQKIAQLTPRQIEQEGIFFGIEAPPRSTQDSTVSDVEARRLQEEGQALTDFGSITAPAPAAAQQDPNAFGNERGGRAEAIEGGGDFSGNGRQVCATEYETKTPGTLVADGLSKSVYSGLDSAMLADEINEAIGVIVTALIQKVITASTGDSGSGVIGGDVNVPAPTIENPAVSFFIGTIDRAISKLQVVEIAQSKEVGSREIQIFRIERQLVPLRNQCSADPENCPQGQINSLESQKSTLKTEKQEWLAKLENTTTVLARLLEFRKQSFDTQDMSTLQNNTSNLNVALIEANRIIQGHNQGQLIGDSVSTNVIDNTKDISDKASRNAAEALLLLEQKINDIGSSTPVTSEDIQNQSLRNVLIQKRSEIQVTLDSLTALNLQVNASRSSQPSVRHALISRSLQRIIELNQKSLEALRL